MQDEFAEGKVSVWTARRNTDPDRIDVENMHLSPREVRTRIIGLLDGLVDVAPSTQFRIQGETDTNLELSVILSDYEKERAQHIIVTVSYSVRENVGQLLISLMWTPQDKPDR